MKALDFLIGISISHCHFLSIKFYPLCILDVLHREWSSSSFRNWHITRMNSIKFVLPNKLPMYIMLVKSHITSRSSFPFLLLDIKIQLMTLKDTYKLFYSSYNWCGIWKVFLARLETYDHSWSNKKRSQEAIKPNSCTLLVVAVHQTIFSWIKTIQIDQILIFWTGSKWGVSVGKIPTFLAFSHVPLHLYIEGCTDTICLRWKLAKKYLWFNSYV